MIGPVERRKLIEYQEHLQNRTEEFEEQKAALLAAGDREAARKLGEEFGAWRSEYTRVGEESGYRQGGIAMSTNMWHAWGLVAFDAELVAKSAGAEYTATRGESDPTGALGRAFRASLTATVAATFMVEGLYGSVCYFVPEVKGNKRWSVILRTLRELFQLDRIGKLDQEIQRLFELRDNAAHPWVVVRPTRPHPEGFANTSVEVATYTPTIASWAIDLACTLLDQCTLHPVETSPSAKRWARANRRGVEQLAALRG
jgi:hypothetical protein